MLEIPQKPYKNRFERMVATANEVRHKHCDKHDGRLCYLDCLMCDILDKELELLEKEIFQKLLKQINNVLQGDSKTSSPQ